MKNFLRSLRFAWPYRGRLLLSVVCAAFGAVVWGAIFTSISPVLHILDKRQNLQHWAQDSIRETQEKIAELESR